jgi:hypothetical protein
MLILGAPRQLGERPLRAGRTPRDQNRVRVLVTGAVRPQRAIQFERSWACVDVSSGIPAPDRTERRRGRIARSGPHAAWLVPGRRNQVDCGSNADLIEVTLCQPVGPRVRVQEEQIDHG